MRATMRTGAGSVAMWVAALACNALSPGIAFGARGTDNGTRLYVTASASLIAAPGGGAQAIIEGVVTTTGAVSPVGLVASLDGSPATPVASLRPQDFIHQGRVKTALFGFEMAVSPGPHLVEVCASQGGPGNPRVACVLVELCAPTSCDAQGAGCGEVGDGCGGTLSCGSCTLPETCGGAGQANVCGRTCVAESDAEMCARLAKRCGEVNDLDSCGVPRHVESCGCCGADQACSAGSCVESPGSVPGRCVAPAHSCTSPGDHYVAVAIHNPPAGMQLNNVRINNHNEVVWSQYQSMGGSFFESDIYSNLRGRISVNSGVADVNPSINDDGLIAWVASLGAGSTPFSWEIVKSGMRLTTDATSDGGPRLMSSGELVWLNATGIRSDVRGQLLVGGASTMDVNNLGDVVYRTGSGNSSTIVRLGAGPLGQGDHPTINDAGEAVWQDFANGNVLRSSTRGALVPGSFPSLNNAGDVAFHRYVAPSSKAFVLRGGVEFPVDPASYVDVLPFPDINDAGMVAFLASRGGTWHAFVAYCAPATR